MREGEKRKKDQAHTPDFVQLVLHSRQVLAQHVEAHIVQGHEFVAGREGKERQTRMKGWRANEGQCWQREAIAGGDAGEPTNWGMGDAVARWGGRLGVERERKGGEGDSR